MTTSEIATVLAWHDALNASDLDTLIALSSDDIEIGDAHGAAQGHEALRNWAAARRGTAELGRMYVHDGVVSSNRRSPAPTTRAPSARPPRRSASCTTGSRRCSGTTAWPRRWRPPN
ncbi:hypothetical protein MAP_3827 [Mycobacterium avium subsp. paratuberculosis K-10]|uniref:SnoaL-like domain-containing protein n=1 Tax=Mycolicibacterium paratuberculosis (strain ATCC BAA-968 / K-10) TaxID=262316 RepID=Q73T91_MYCPA|nr:hypothetical protein MAP_3827 [Mycobacterium avium subsp. paratuberculosis K-10]AGL38783.1 hypothetical protein MAP4_3940 [Mycobacterium avium subsp. paratuberculosis MAP4]